MTKSVVAMILAGGQGTRLGLLTDEVAKPAVPFGGKYRIIDFTLSNCVNSGIFDVGILTQYRPHVLSKHIGIGRHWDLDRKDGGVVMLPPFQGRSDADWYSGTANAIYQNIDFIDSLNPEIVLILSGDHIYAMDYNEIIDFHFSKMADGTIACMRVPISEASRFGLMVTNFEGRITEFQEKPQQPKSNLASLGIYVFTWNFLKEKLIEDAHDQNSGHDFGKNIIPKIVSEDSGRLFAFSFEGYWRDVGTLQAYWESNLELTRPVPGLNLHDPTWRFYTHSEEYPPAYFSSGAKIRSSLISEGCEVHGIVENSLLFQGVKVGKDSIIKDSVIMTNCIIGQNCTIEKAIISERTIIGNNVQLGIGEEKPNKISPEIYNGGLVVVGSDVKIPDGVKIGKNTAIWNYVRESQFKGVVLSGEILYPEER
ncbi:glucose-1-phosphate adenylyltransferase [Kosmotoga arenicorallina S304]|uniref:Glucose-1-phosphate adenylyltransferase n=1 Tax=Kosmotoga arenicorallina S304 TaxID=1453497 RepID=A0A176K1F9_9BACT|nr:glucose-1-phosphate adenylyltransferase [Kosmotoga arenicorallina]OAA30966.1 glucose-1-phosphate adenylyltransferase [Kosmotoga arenicorallina S304]